MRTVLDVVCESAGKAATNLTRRDIARALLSIPATDALSRLAGLRRELMAAGNPLTIPFWNSTEATLSSISTGVATIGDVRGWLEATGTEPLELIPGELFVWPDPEERGPVADEIHALLVTHLESLVADGTIDPDKLAAGDKAALADYQRIQVDWLRTPQPDGRVPMDAVSDEADGAFLAEWDEAEADARRILNQMLAPTGDRPYPETELRAACTRLREGLGGRDRSYRLLRAAAGVDPRQLPDDDHELWLTLAASVVVQRDDPPSSILDEERRIAWEILDHASWIGAAVSLARRGPGAHVDADTLAQDVATFELDDEAEYDVDDEPWPDDAEALSDEILHLSVGFHTVVLLWQTLGAIDTEDRLTELGWWGIPEALQHAWRPAEPDV